MHELPMDWSGVRFMQLSDRAWTGYLAELSYFNRGRAQSRREQRPYGNKALKVKRLLTPEREHGNRCAPLTRSCPWINFT
jgi:hypothetical protein